MNEEAIKFVEWMRKIQNIHYADNEQMAAAIQRVLPLKCQQL